MTAQIEQMRLNPVNVQNVVTYNVVIDVNNPEQKLKPGMTANLTITIDERNNVLKVPNSALRFTPTDASGQRIGRGGGNSNDQTGGQGGQRRQRGQQADGANGAPAQASTAPTGKADNGQQASRAICSAERAGVAGSDANNLGDGPGWQATVSSHQGGA